MEDSSDISEEEAISDNSGFALLRHTHTGGRPRHPSIDRIHQLWETFVSNVDPLTKVVHVPSLRPMIEKAADSSGVIPRALEALMFAIYGSAVMSLSRNEWSNGSLSPVSVCFLNTSPRQKRHYREQR